MLTFEQLQNEVAEWANRNFGNKEKIDLNKDGTRPAWHPLLGVSEEAGELCHAYLKMQQKIRGGTEVHIDEARDAVGDIMIYLADFCALMGFDMQEIIEDTWGQVQKRDWEKNPEDGE